MHQKILILDFGSQYTQLIARRVREANVYCEIHPYSVTDTFILEFNPIGIILSGGPHSAFENHTPKISPAIFDVNVPVLGICYGMQAMAIHFGGQVIQGQSGEFGHAKIQIEPQSDLFDGITLDQQAPHFFDVWMSHADSVTELPDGFRVVASNESTPIAAMEDVMRKLYGVQFHPEVTHTRQGQAILDRFLHRICGATGDWKMADYIQESVAQIREQVGNEHVVLGLSGGVDSSVVAALVHKAIGDQLTCVFVDHGLLRLNEADNVMTTFAQNLGVKVIKADASDHFLSALAGVSDPEEKRKIIGKEFITVFQAEAEKIKGATWLAQGTIYPDVIESAGHEGKSSASTIKSHHNVGGLPEDLALKLLEPLRYLFKDEVRQMGIALGLPHDMVYRHPFPGPGLGVRVLGDIKKEYLDMLRRADAIFIEELRQAGWYDKVSQALAVFLPVKTVGVMGDSRTYDFVIALRAVDTKDFMTAEWVYLPGELLGRVSNRIINEVRGINRVVYDISGKPPATIEWE